MKKCLKCNTENPDSFKTCWSCGNELPASEARDKTVDLRQRQSHNDSKMSLEPDSLRRGLLLLVPVVAAISLIVFGVVLSSSSGPVDNASQGNDTSRKVSLFGIELGSVEIATNSFNARHRDGGYEFTFHPAKQFLSFRFYSYFVDDRSGKITSVSAESLSDLDASVAYKEIETTITAIKKKFGVPNAKVEEQTFTTPNTRDILDGSTIYGEQRTFYTVELSDRYILEASAQSWGGHSRLTARSGRKFSISVMVRDKLSQLSKDDVEVL